jgi:hypothetical protein
MSLLTIVLLLFPGSALDSIWHLNPEAHAAFRSLGPLSILVMALVCCACSLAAIGLARGKEWGPPLAIVILAVNLLGDSVNALLRHDLRTLIGIPIGGAMILYLLRVKAGHHLDR